MDRSENFYSILEQAEEVYKDRDFAMEYNGHYPFEKKYLQREMHYGFYSFPEEGLKLLADKQKLPKAELLRLPGTQCPYCSEYISFLFDGETLKVSAPCKFAGGIKEVSVELNVPSGKMVFANDLRQWFRVHGDFNVNADVGIMQTMKAYEKVGMAHGFVSNTCPSVYKKNKQTLSISAPEREEVWDEKEKDYFPKTKKQIKKETPKGKQVGGICTDLWWYCIVDYEDFKTRFLDSGESKKQFDKYIKERCNVVDVKPGVYAIQHLFSGARKDPEEGQPHHYAHITWTRKPEQRELYQQYKKLNRTISQCWLASLAKYPTLYGFREEELPEELTVTERVEKLKTFPPERIEHSFQHFLDHTFCTLGAGVDWHDNGWGSSQEVGDDIPDIPTPVLTKKYYWYPMSRTYCALYLSALKKTNDFGDKVGLNESFLAAAYEVIHCLLSFGAERRSSITHESVNKEAHDKELKYALKEAEEQVVIAQECLQGFSERYPGTVPEKLKPWLKAAKSA